MPSAPAKSPENMPLHERVYREVRHALIAGRFAPGQKLTSRGLAEVLGTSDMPVRAALGRLVAEGGLLQRPNGTVAVPVVGRKEFAEVMELRAMLEGRAAGLAAGRVDAPGLKGLRELAKALKAAAESEDIVRYLDANQKLKFAIYAHCDAPVLLALIENLWLLAGPFLRHLSRNLRAIMDINFHQQAIAAIDAGDARGASAAIARDIREGMKQLLRTGRFAEDESLQVVGSLRNPESS